MRLRSASTAVVWLADGIAEDDETDGHVDNVVAFAAPGRALLQGCATIRTTRTTPIAADNRARLEAAGIEVVEIPTLPYADDRRRLGAGAVRQLLRRQRRRRRPRHRRRRRTPTRST